ncbi:MAG: hypothetical protein K2Z81_04400 [Cyanobacteria bacterium]|nr:hypothetical protein [Cyanobacteriota bacterium]
MNISGNQLDIGNATTCRNGRTHYTRSFVDDGIFEELSLLSSEPNCIGWLCLDRDNYELGIIRYCQAHSGLWKIALLQEQQELMPSELIPRLAEISRYGDLVSFPKHHAGRLKVCPIRHFLLQDRIKMVVASRVSNREKELVG